MYECQDSISKYPFIYILSHTEMIVRERGKFSFKKIEITNTKILIMTISR